MEGSAPPIREPEIGGAKILIAEDDGVTRSMLNDLLRAEGFRTFLARDGAEALQIDARERVDLLLLDVMMPVYDGFEVCRRSKDAARLEGRYLPVLFLTALAQKEARMQGLALGGDDYLTKPFHRAEVLLRVRGLLSTKFLYDEILRKYLALERLDEMQRRLTAFVVHDLKNPLTGLMANLQLLEREMGAEASERSRSFLHDARTSAKRLFEMIGNILDISQMEEGRLSLHRAPLDVPALLRESLQDFEAVAGAKNLVLEDRVEPGLPRVEADHRLIVRVLSNLVGNAVRHTPRGGRVVLEGRFDPAGAQLLLAVIDEAPRISKEHYHLIFQRFGRIEVPGSGGGHGLGLTFCRLAAEAHGGGVYVQEAEGAGNQFVVTLPVRPPAR